MPKELPPYDPNAEPTPEPERSNRLIGFIREVGHRVFPYQVVAHDSDRFEGHIQELTVRESDVIVEDIEELRERVRQNEAAEAQRAATRYVVTRDRGSYWYREDEPGEPQRIREPMYRFVDDFQELYFAMGPGVFTVDEIADRIGKRGKEVKRVCDDANSELPDEICKAWWMNDDTRIVQFGNFIASTQVRKGPAIRVSEDVPPLPRRHQKESLATLDKGKVDLTKQDHVIIATEVTTENNIFYLPLNSAETILAARVIQALKQIPKRHDLTPTAEGNPRASSHQIATIAWESMTLAERRIFVDSKENARIRDGGVFLEEATIDVLRQLTNQLKLTHERHSDAFTLLLADFTVSYARDPLSDEEIANRPHLRPLLLSDHFVDSPDPSKRRLHVDLARIYTRTAMEGGQIEDKHALDMLNFMMSPAGHWAINETAGQPGFYPTPAVAEYMIHRYLRRNFRSYGPAYPERLIGGGRRMRPGGSIHRTGGRLRYDSKWVLGTGMAELYNQAQPPKEEKE